MVKMYANTLESSHLQELLEYVEVISENKRPVTKAKDSYRLVVLGKPNSQYPGMPWLKFTARDNEEHLAETESGQKGGASWQLYFSFVDRYPFWNFINHYQECKAHSEYLAMFTMLPHLYF